MTTPVETLREAARLMRERAEDSAPGRWMVDMNGAVRSANEYVTGPLGNEAAYIASWHPAVALAVADWLEYTAATYVDAELEPAPHAPSLAVARAYLGETS